jgi:uncharacterized phage protein gp47/JayE
MSKSYEDILKEVLNNAPPGIDTRQGSIYYDSVAGICLTIARLYTDIETQGRLVTIVRAVGEELTVKAAEYGIARHPAAPAKYHFSYEGEKPSVGERFYNDGSYFVLMYSDDGYYYLQAEAAGAEPLISSGTAAIPVNEVAGMTAATFGELIESGTEEEDDDSLRTRVQEKIAGPAENGNKQHYKSWCESIDGIGHARIYPLWNGPNTVKAVLIDSSGRACSSEKVKEVQNYIDPATRGYTANVDGYTYTVGDGTGDGVANLGAHFTAVSAREMSIDVSFSADLASGYTKDIAKNQVKAALEAYLEDLALNVAAAEDVIIRAARIGAIIIEQDAILDYSDLTINGGTSNIAPGDNAIPVLGEVTVS